MGAQAHEVVSIHAFRGEGDLAETPIPAGDRRDVSIHAFRGEGDYRGYWTDHLTATSFNPRLPGGRRRSRPMTTTAMVRFNPRLPGGRRRDADRQSNHRDVSIHAFRGEGDVISGTGCCVMRVSIHAFRGEGDARAGNKRVDCNVSIHAFRGEGDMYALVKRKVDLWFQSTPSGGKAT